MRKLALKRQMFDQELAQAQKAQVFQKSKFFFSALCSSLCPSFDMQSYNRFYEMQIRHNFALNNRNAGD